jgi:hypothetical protein
VNYKWLDESKWKELQMWVIAQEVEKVFPEVVYTDNEWYKSVAYAQLVWALIESIKELKSEKDTQINELKSEIANLKK